VPASTKTKPKRTPARGLLLTSRVRAILVSVYEHRQLSREQITRLHFQPLLRKENRYPSIMPRLTLQRLTEHGYLIARPRPVERAAGRPPLVYSIGENAIPVVAETLDRPIAQLLPRVRLDQELSWLFYAHRSAISDVRISLTLACEQQGRERQARCLSGHRPLRQSRPGFPRSPAAVAAEGVPGEGADAGALLHLGRLYPAVRVQGAARARGD
jgi:hypothetical protein